MAEIYSSLRFEISNAHIADHKVLQLHLIRSPAYFHSIVLENGWKNIEKIFVARGSIDETRRIQFINWSPP